MSGLPKSSRLKLAVVSDTIYPWTKGGAEIRYYEIYRRLAQKHDVHWFTMKYRGMRNKPFNFEGIEVHCVCNGPDNLYRNGRRKLFPALFYTLGILLQMRKYRFDVIDVNETPFIPLFVVWLLRLIHSRTIIVSVWHEHWSLQYWQRYLGFLMGIGGYIIQHATSHIPDVLIPVSNTTKRLVAKYTGRKEKDMELVENAVDCMITRALREQVSPKRTRIITVSRLIPEKRVDKFIALVEKLHRIQPDIEAVVVGDGPERFQLEALATGLPIRFLGSLKDHKVVLKEIAMSTVFVSFSTREGFNIAALEACQLGLNTYATLVLFDHVNIHPLNEQSIASIIDDFNTGKDMNHVIDRRYCWVEVARRTEEILIENRRKR